MTVSDLRRLRALEAENRRPKQIVAEQALDNVTLKQLLSKTSSLRSLNPREHVENRGRTLIAVGL